MIKQIVINTSPLIALGKMRMTDLLFKLPFDFVCPPQVQAEISIGAAKGYAVGFPKGLKVAALKQPLSALVLANLDAGEAAVIELALQENIEMVCIDELKGRRAATAAGLEIVGSLGILGKAKNLKLIPAARPFIEKAQTSGIYYDPKLISSFLKSLNE